MVSENTNAAPGEPKARDSTDSGSWRKPLFSAGKLGLGRGVQAVCSLAYLGVAARVLGIEDFGALALIHSLCLAIAQLTRFQSWAFTIRFGTPALGKSSMVGLHRVLNFGFTLDLVGVLLGVAVFASGFSAFAGWTSLPESIRGFAILYGVIAITLINLAGSAMGVLRLLDRFSALAWQSTLEPLVRLGGSLLMLMLGGGLRGFLVVWLVALLINKLTLVYAAFRALRSRGLADGLRFDPSVVWDPDAGMWRFAWGTQWDATLKLGERHLPMLMVGSFAGVASAGLFKVAQQFSDAIVNLNTKLLVPAVFPEIARLTDAGRVAERKALMLKASAFVATLIALLFIALAIFGRPLIVAIAGAGFAGAYETMLWLAFGGFVGAIGFTLEPFLLAKGDTRSVISANALALVVQLTLLLTLLPRLGVVGAGIAAVAQVGTRVLLLLVLFRNHKEPAEAQVGERS